MVVTPQLRRPRWRAPKLCAPSSITGRPCRAANGVDALVIGHLAKEAHRQDGLGARRHGRLDRVNVNIVGRRLDIHKHRPRPHQGDDLRRADPRVRHSDDFVAGADAQRAQGDFQAGRSAGHCNTMFYTNVSGQRFFQFGHFRPQDELAVSQHALNAPVNLGFVTPILLL